MLIDEDIGFLEKVFGYQTRVSHQVFLQLIGEKNYNFVEPHRIRMAVYTHLKELLIQQGDNY